MTRALLRRADHDLKEVFERPPRVFGEAGVDGARLHDGAAGRGQPPEALDGGK